ncbi:MAG TPA: NAD(P)/FAD-dependent oxidoreductase [Chloroflexia bacterium]|nr:NAD(P)/FAD-dependent oxidoreductase [Chloroflexia bacterium]
MRLGIIGGGALGLTVAMRRAALGDEVVVFEKGKEPGGLAVSFPVTERGKDGPYLEKFYHHIFKTDKDIIRLIDEVGLGNDLLWKTPPTSTLRNGKIYRMDSAFDEWNIKALKPLVGSSIDTAVAIMRFKPMPILARLRFGLVGAYLKFESNYRRLSKTTAVKWVQKWAGKAAFENIFKPLLSAKFGSKYDQIAMPWLWSRFHERTQFLGYLQGGFHRLYMKMYEAAQKAGSTVLLDSDVTAIRNGSGDQADKVIVTVNGREEVFDKVVVTVPTRIFTQMAKDTLPASYVEKYAGPNSIEHYGAHCVVLSLDRKFFDTYWLNVNDPGYPFLAVVEHTNFMPPSDYDGQHLMYLGNYLPMDHELFKKSDEEVLAQFLPHLKKINPDFDPSWVVKSWVLKAPYAQPIVTIDYPEKLPPHETPLRNVYLANMAHVYPQDRGQNYSIRLGEKMAKLL